MPRKFEYSPNFARAERLIIVLKIYFIALALALISGFANYLILSSGNTGVDSLEMNDIRQFIVGSLQFVLFLITGVMFLIWFQAAYRNLYVLRKIETTKEPSWAVWGFIIPIISLFYPYKIASEIWIGNQEYVKSVKPEFEINRETILIGWWWAFYLVSNLLSNFLFRMSDNFSSLTQSKIFLVSDMIDLIGIGITLKMVEMLIETEELVNNARIYSSDVTE